MKKERRHDTKKGGIRNYHRKKFEISTPLSTVDISKDGVPWIFRR